MAKKKDSKEKKKPIFEKVGLVFRSPIRADIMRELSSEVQRPVDLAKKFDMKKQAINYHIGELKRGGLIKTHTEEIEEPELQTQRGMRFDGRSETGKLQVSYGVELTKNGKNIVNEFLDPLYEEEKNKNNKKEDK
ncbi:MAG: helix-turn-helix domain-containing protein [Candidatus Lokiarchaeia archaeon]|nr:helix-turn-helix domain-containing protein [Candidatus Lokiarchaeia archaeon]